MDAPFSERLFQNRGKFPRRLLQIPRLWQIRIAVVAGILLLSLIVGQKPTILFLLPLVGIGGLIVLSRWPGLGLPGLVVASIAIPVTIGTGTGSSLPAPMLLLAALVGFWTLDMIARQKQIQILQSRTFLPLVLLIAGTAISLLVGQLPWFTFAGQTSLAAQLGGFSIFLFSALAYFWVAHQVQDVRWLKLAVWLFLLLGAIYIVGQLWYPLYRLLGTYIQRGAIAGSLFWTWLAAMSFSQLLFNRKLQRFQRAALSLFVAGLFYVAYVQTGFWKSGWLPPAVSVAAIAVLFVPRLAFVVALPAIGPMIDFVQGLIASDQYSFSTRVEAWEILWEISKRNPIFGLGPANYYNYTTLFPIRGYYVQFNSHNQYVDLIAQVGVVGLLFFLWFIYEVGKLGWALREQVPEGFQRAYVYGVLGGLAGTVFAGALGDWILPFVYNVGFNGFRASIFAWIFLGGLVALKHMTSDGERE